MKRRSIVNAYEPIRPDEEARMRMLQNILLSSEIPPAGKDDTMKHKKMRPMMLAALIALVAAMTVTAFAAEEISGWFKQYFLQNSENGLTPGQIEFLDEHEQVIDETQTSSGYDLKLKSVLSDGYTVYATVGLAAPADVTKEHLKGLWGSAIDFYDENKKPSASWSMDIRDDRDGLENTVDLLFEITPADWNSGSMLTIRINALERMFYDAAYEQELLETKYAGQDNIMFTDEESARIHQKILMAEGPWEFTIDLSAVETQVLELITDPVTVQTSYGFKEDGTDLFEQVCITSLRLSPLSATVQTDADYAPDFAAGGRKVYAVMTDGSRIELVPNWGGGGKQYFNAASPIVLEDVDHILFDDGTKIMAP